MRKDAYDVVVIGGGFFGIAIALEARRYKRDVLVLESAPALMTRASYANQARVHQGYHYPRSLLTAERSSANFAQFVETYRDCVVDSFTKVYAIARHHSKVSAAQFARFCERVGAPLEDVSPAIEKLFDRKTVERAFKVREYAFDAIKLRALLERRLAEANVEVARDTEAKRIGSGSQLHIDVVAAHGPTRTIAADWVFNATYANANQVLARSQLELVPLKHELAEIALVRPPPSLRDLGITLMDGPFFSCMPFPSANAHSLTHVRYTPHESWHESPADEVRRSERPLIPGSNQESLFAHMLRDAARFVPDLAQSEYVRSIWEIKTLLPLSEQDDSRPILFRRNAREPRVVSTLGAKIDNVVDLTTHVRDLLQ